MSDSSLCRCDVRRASVEDAHVVHAVRQRAIRGSAAGLYDSDALEAWASGSSEAELRRKIETTAAFVAVVDGQVIGWGNLVVHPASRVLMVVGHAPRTFPV